MSSQDDIDPDEYVRENRETLLAIIKNSDDAFTRACAWTLLDRHTADVSVEELQNELETVTKRREES